MTPEEKFHKDVLYVLEQIKEKFLYTQKGKPIEYWVKYVGYRNPVLSSEKEAAIIEKLPEYGIIKIRSKDVSPSEHYIEAEIFYLEIVQPEFDNFYKKLREIDTKLEGIDENPWFSKESKTIKRKRLFKKQRKQSKENKISLPTDPDVIEEYLNILNRIEKERQRTPKGEPIAFPIPKGVFIAKGVPLPEQEISILRIFGQNGIIEITEKTIPIINEFDPYENSETIRAVKIPDLDKFTDCRNKLLESKEILEGTNKELEEQIKSLKKLEKQISLVARSSSVKNYEEAFEKISEQLAPLKDALERIGRAQRTVKISLTPTLQRLAPSLKKLEKQIKNFDELHKTPDSFLPKAIISPDLIRVQQGDEMISELKEIRKLIEKSTIKKDELKPIKWFNHKNNSISFYGDTYKPRGEPQAQFIRQLTTRHQKENNNGTILKPGQRVSEKILSSEINMTIKQLRNIKKQLKRSFKDKGFPLKIDLNAEGILLIYTI